MNDAPLFSDLIVSRPAPSRRPRSRTLAIALALSLHVTLLAGIALAPFFILEVMQPPKATVQIVLPAAPRGRPQGDNRAAALIRRGRPDARPAASPSPAPPRVAQAARQLQPRPTAVPPPDPNPAHAQALPLTDGPPAGPDIPGDPDGTGSSPTGTTTGREGEVGTGPRGPGLDETALEGPLGPDFPGLTQPVLIPASRALPKYPDLARRAGLQGSVILLIVVGADGTVGEIEVVRSPDQRWGFDLSAIEAVKQWRYHPALLNGRPVSVYAQVIVEFALSR